MGYLSVEGYLSVSLITIVSIVCILSIVSIIYILSILKHQTGVLKRCDNTHLYMITFWERYV